MEKIVAVDQPKRSIMRSTTDTTRTFSGRVNTTSSRSIQKKAHAKTDGRISHFFQPQKKRSQLQKSAATVTTSEQEDSSVVAGTEEKILSSRRETQINDFRKRTTPTEVIVIDDDDDDGCGGDDVVEVVHVCCGEAGGMETSSLSREEKNKSANKENACDLNAAVRPVATADRNDMEGVNETAGKVRDNRMEPRGRFSPDGDGRGMDAPCTQDLPTGDSRTDDEEKVNAGEGVTAADVPPPPAARPTAAVASTDVDDDASCIGDDNPFANFAFQTDGPPAVSSPPFVNVASSSRNQSLISKKKRKLHGGSAPKGKKGSSAGDKGDDWIKMKDLSPIEQERVTSKWHSLVVENDTLPGANAAPEKMAVPMEVARFQIVVATRLHARCQEPAVRKAMIALHRYFAERMRPADGEDVVRDDDDYVADTDSEPSTAFTVENMAKADPEELSSLINNLQFYRVKARHLVKSAGEIINRFGGIVPESETQLQQLTGVGPVMSDLLSFINTRAVHEKRRADQGGAIDHSST